MNEVSVSDFSSMVKKTSQDRGMVKSGSNMSVGSIKNRSKTSQDEGVQFAKSSTQSLTKASLTEDTASLKNSVSIKKRSQLKNEAPPFVIRYVPLEPPKSQRVGGDVMCCCGLFRCCRICFCCRGNADDFDVGDDGCGCEEGQQPGHWRARGLGTFQSGSEAGGWKKYCNILLWLLLLLALTGLIGWAIYKATNPSGGGGRGAKGGGGKGGGKGGGSGGGSGDQAGRAESDCNFFCWLFHGYEDIVW